MTRLAFRGGAAAGAALCTLLVGCASGGSTSGAFKSYANSFATAEAAVAAHSLPDLEAVYAADLVKTNGAGLLANLEMGAFYQALGDFERSRVCLDRADGIAREIEQRAIVSGRSAIRNLGSLLTNDRVIEFRGDAYEKVMARSLNAINYLMLGDREGARIEVRKAAEYQDQELRDHEAKLHEMEQEAPDQQQERSTGEQGLAASAEFEATLKSMDDFARDFENSFQNPFTYFLSGLIYDLNGEVDDAYLDYRRAYELWPQSRPAAEFLASAAAARASLDELATLSHPVDGAVVQAASSSRREAGRLVVVYGADLIPRKQEVKFPIPVPGVSDVTWVAFATYTDYIPTEDRLVVDDSGNEYRTEPIVNLRALAVRALQEKWKATAARQVGRAITKAVAKEKLKKELGEKGGALAGALAGLAGTIYQAVSEGADLRAWYSLPDQLQIVSIPMTPGEHLLRLRRTGGPGQTAEFTVQISPDQPAVVFARGFGQVFGAWQSAEGSAMASVSVP